MNVTIEDLAEKGYLLKETLRHEEIVSFVQKVFNEPNIITRTYFYISFLSFIGFGIMIVLHMLDGGSFIAVVGHFSWGILLTILLIPVHEGLHGLVYKFIGAPKVSYTADFKRFIFTAQADQFIINEKEFYYLAFTPFLVISLGCILVGLLFPAYFMIATCIFVFHTMACGGDFGLAAYFYQHSGTGMVTYDDVEAKESYFFVEPGQEEE